MWSREIFRRFVILIAVEAQLGFAGPAGYVTLINATPYDWKLTSIRQYQMEYGFPSLITAGE
jgi:hypothetical protein